MAEHTARKASREARDEDPQQGPVSQGAPQDAPAPPLPDDTPKVAVGRLVEESQDFLGVPSYVAAGAFSGESGELTVEQARHRVQEWLDSPAGEGA